MIYLAGLGLHSILRLDFNSLPGRLDKKIWLLSFFIKDRFRWCQAAHGRSIQLLILIRQEALNIFDEF